MQKSRGSKRHNSSWDNAFGPLEQRLMLTGEPGGGQPPIGAPQTEFINWHGVNIETALDSWIITFDDIIGRQGAVTRAQQVIARLGVQGVDVQAIGRGGYAKFKAVGNFSEFDVARVLAEMPDVRMVEPNIIHHIQQVPNDPLLGNQWQHINGGQNILGQNGQLDADGDSDVAWDSTVGSENVVVAVIDTGIDLDHPDLAANIWQNPGEIPGNGIDDDGNGLVDDYNGYDFADGDSNPNDINGHGTNSAGMIGAVGNNGVGVAGMSWTVSMIAIKVFSNFGGGADTANIVAAHDYLTDLIENYGINIVASNNSYGSFLPEFFDEFEAAQEAAIQRFTRTGAAFVAAAGNDGNDNDTTFTAYPASFQNPDIIAVAATDNQDNLAVFSNFGLTTVDVAAPGDNIFTTDLNGGYRFTSGTSFSSPYVAGIVALLRTIRPNASADEIKRALIQGSDQLPSLQSQVVSGGRVNAANSIRLIQIEGPRIVAISPGPVAANVTELLVQFDREINPAFLSPTFITLRQANGDATFDGDDTFITIDADDLTLDGTVLRIDLSQFDEFPAGLPVDQFRLFLDAEGFRDMNGNYLNGNTTPPTSLNDETYDFRVVVASGVFEPNDTLALATPVIFGISGDAIFSGAQVGDGSNNIKDVDLYRLELTGPGLIVADVIARRLDVPSQLDSFLRLFDASGREMTNNDNFAGLDSRIEFFVPTGGTYYIGVSGFANMSYNPLVAASGTPTQSTGEYELSVDVSLAATETISHNSTTTPTAIPIAGTMTSTIQIVDGRRVADVNVRLTITHPFVSELQIRLISARGTVVNLVMNRGGSGDNFTSTIFDDEAAAAVGGAAAPFTGSFRPEGPLSAIDGETAAGAWTLQITDNSAINQGTLASWGIDLTLENNIFGPFESNDTIALASIVGITGVGTQTLAADIGDGAFGLRDVDLFRFTAASGTTITVTLTVTQGSLDSVLRLFDITGAELVLDNPAGTTGSTFSLSISTGGTYFVGVSGEANTTYVLTSGGSGQASDATGSYSLVISVVGGISEGAVLLNGDRLDVGVNADGSIGVPGGTGPGFLFNGTELITPPQGPNAGIESFFGGTYQGYIFRNAGPGNQSDLLVSVANESDFANQRLVVSGQFRDMGVRRTLSYGRNDGFVAVEVTLTNTSSFSTLTDVAWMEAFNPQTGLNRQTTIRLTNNNVDNGTGRLVTGSWTDSDFPQGLTIGLAAPDLGSGVDVVGAVQSTGVIRDPFQILDTVNPDPDTSPADTGVSADSLLAMAFRLGNLAPGGSMTFRYFILAGSSIGEVQALFETINDGTGTGHLAVNPDTTPAFEDLPYRVYYPEGYANDRASTFVPIANPNETGARVVVVARYERGTRDQVLYDSLTGDINGDGVADGTIGAHTRSGLTLTTPALYAADAQLVRKDEPYAIEIWSSQPIAANLSHFDFGVSTGEAFTSAASAIWTFAEGFKGTGVNDFLVFYNPNPETISVTLTIYPETGAPAFSLAPVQVEAFRRGGFSLNDIAQLPAGPFGMRLTAQEGIVAALTHFDTNIGGGFGILGDPFGGVATGASPEGQLGINATAEFVTVLNTNDTAADINFTFYFANGSAYRQQVTVPANRRGGFSVANLPAFPTGQQSYSIAYDSTQPISVNLASFAYGEATGSGFSNLATTQWYFAEGFRPLTGNQVTEYLRLYNPQAADVTVEITLDFNDGSSETFRTSIGARTSNEIDLHDFITGDRATIGTVPGVGTFYGVRVRAPEGIVAYMGHFDQNFFGGFGTLGTPLGTFQFIQA